VDHAAVGNVRLHRGRDPEHRTTDGERNQEPPAAAKASKPAHRILPLPADGGS
jgi:hypothetical protein